LQEELRRAEEQRKALLENSVKREEEVKRRVDEGLLRIMKTFESRK